MKLDLVKPALILVILVLGFLLFRSCDDKKEIIEAQDQTEWRTIVHGLQADTARAGHRIDSLTAELQKVQAESKKAVTGLKVAVRARDKSLEQARQEIAQIRTEIPAVDSFVVAADSAIAVRDALVSRLESDLYMQNKLHTEQVGAMAARHVATVALSQSYEARVSELETKLRRSERRRKTNRLVMLIMTGGLATVILLNQ